MAVTVTYDVDHRGVGGPLRQGASSTFPTMEAAKAWIDKYKSVPYITNIRIEKDA